MPAVRAADASLRVADAAPVAIASASAVGLWKTFDDKNGQAESVIRIWEKDGKLYGAVDRLLVEIADHRPDPPGPAAEGHGPEADF